MAISSPVSDLARSTQHERSFEWPESVKIQVKWVDKAGRPAVRTHEISADEFFGHGSHGAPLSGEHLIQAIERMRRQGPPKVHRGKNSSKTTRSTL